MGRNVKLETLRLLAIFLIVISHFSTAVVKGYEVPITTNTLFIFGFGKWGGVGNDIFLVISCLFLTEKNKFSSIRVIKIIFKTWFYVLLSLMFAVLLELQKISCSNIVKVISSPFSGAYWFITAYLIMLFVGPIIGEIVEHLDFRNNFRFICTYTFVIIYISLWDLTKASDIIFVTYIYTLVSIIKKYSLFDKKILNNNRNNFLILLCMWIVGILSWIIMTLLGVGKLAGILTRRYAIWTLLMAVILVFTVNRLRFSEKKRKSECIILGISKSTLAIYILQENIWLAKWLELNILKLDIAFEKNIFYLFAIGGTIILIMIIGLLDVIIRYMMDKYIFAKCKKMKYFGEIDQTINME